MQYVKTGTKLPVPGPVFLLTVVQVVLWASRYCILLLSFGECRMRSPISSTRNNLQRECPADSPHIWDSTNIRQPENFEHFRREAWPMLRSRLCRSRRLGDEAIPRSMQQQGGGEKCCSPATGSHKGSRRWIWRQGQSLWLLLLLLIGKALSLTPGTTSENSGYRNITRQNRQPHAVYVVSSLRTACSRWSRASCTPAIWIP